MIIYQGVDPWGFLHFARSLKVVSGKTSKTWPDHLFQKLEINQGGGGRNTWTCEQWYNCAVPGVVFVQRTFGFNLCTIHKYICLRFRLFGERTFKPIRRWVCTLRSRAINVTTSRGNGRSKTKTFSTTSSLISSNALQGGRTRLGIATSRQAPPCQPDSFSLAAFLLRGLLRWSPGE